MIEISDAQNVQVCFRLSVLFLRKKNRVGKANFLISKTLSKNMSLQLTIERHLMMK